MSLLELGEAFLWFCLCVALTAVGLLAALLGMGLSYFRGTKSGRTPLVCAFVAAFTTLLLWLTFVFIDPPAAMIFAAGMSLATFMAFASWLSRYDRD
jgi:hypothetical protein